MAMENNRAIIIALSLFNDEKYINTRIIANIKNAPFRV
jgi:hypothetical protein